MPDNSETPAVVFLIGPSGDITTWSAECEQALGYRGDQVIRRPLVQICNRQRCAEIEAYLAAAALARRQGGGDATATTPVI